MAEQGLVELLFQQVTAAELGRGQARPVGHGKHLALEVVLQVLLQEVTLEVVEDVLAMQGVVRREHGAARNAECHVDLVKQAQGLAIPVETLAVQLLQNAIAQGSGARAAAREHHHHEHIIRVAGQLLLRNGLAGAVALVGRDAVDGGQRLVLHGGAGLQQQDQQQGGEQLEGGGHGQRCYISRCSALLSPPRMT